MANPQFTLYSSGTTPNPAKVGILLEELNLSYKIINRKFGDGPDGVKASDFLAINPNGRVPALIDHSNNEKIIWESAAILYYIAEKYDNSGKFLGKNIDEKAEVMQWLTFQVSGMGPMQGQVNYFRRLHPVKDLDQSVYDRFNNETYRVWNVFEKRLEGKEWLALDRFTVADIAVFTWLKVAPNGGLDLSKFPKLQAYYDRILEMPSVKAAYEKLIDASK